MTDKILYGRVSSGRFRYGKICRNRPSEKWFYQIQDQIQGQEAEEQVIDLSKLKKKDLLEIMLKQGEEIDNLRAQVSDLQAQLEERNFKIYKAGSIAEASLQVTKIFEEAEKAAMIYLENIRSKVQ